MKVSKLAGVAIVAAALGAGPALAQQGATAAPPAAGPVASASQEYVTVRVETDVNKPAAEVWAKVGANYCDLSKWIRAGATVPCAVTSGDGGIGSVRSIANGAVIEVMVAKTDLSYGYAQPAKNGQFYNHYHGFMEAKPVSATTSKIIYTLMQDVSNLADQAAKDAVTKRLRDQFTAALANMKKLAEGG
jgi:hypothetical protein